MNKLATLLIGLLVLALLASFFLFQQPHWGQLGAIGIVAFGPLLILSYYMQRLLIRSFSIDTGR